MPKLSQIFSRTKKECEVEITGLAFQNDWEAVDNLVRHLELAYPDKFKDMAPYQVGKTYLGPSLRLKTGAVLGTIWGGSGKSTLFNALPELLDPNLTSGPAVAVADPADLDVLSPTSRRPGLTKRTLVGRSNAPGANSNEYLNDVHERLKPHGYGQEPWNLERYRSPDQVATEGDPVDVIVDNLPPNMFVMDSRSPRVGDPRRVTDPNHRAAAEAALVPADYVLLMLDAATINDHQMLDDIRRTYQRFGVKQTIPILNSDAGISDAEASEMMTEALNIIFDRPVDTVGIPEGVPGLYVNINDSRVAAGLAHARPRKVGDSPEFANLLRHIAAQPTEYKAFSLKMASLTMKDSVGEEIRQETKRRLATQIWRQALRALVYTVAKDNTKDYPFAEGERAWRMAFEERGNAASAYLNRLGEWAGKPERVISDLVAGGGNLVRLAKGRGKRPGRVELGVEKTQAEQLKAQPLYDKAIITQVQNALASGRLILIENPKLADRRKAGDQLVAHVREFFELFPEEKQAFTPCKVEEGRVCVFLPSRQLLSDEVNRELQSLIQNSPTNLMDDIHPATAVADLALTADNVVKQLDIARGKYPWRSKMFNASLDFLGMFTLVSAGTMMQNKIGYGGAIPLVLSYLAGSVPARFVRFWSEARRDRGYRKRINTWFRDLQFTTINQGLDNVVLKKLEETLEAPAPERIKHLREVQRSLHYFNPDFPDYPDYIAIDLKK